MDRILAEIVTKIPGSSLMLVTGILDSDYLREGGSGTDQGQAHRKLCLDV